MSQPRRRASDFDMHAVLVQGDSVRMTWGLDEPVREPRKPLRRDGQFHEPAAPVPVSDDLLRIRLGEELDYARRLLDVTGDSMSADPLAVGRHGLALQSLDVVGQMLGHIANVIRSGAPAETIEAIGMGDLKARLQRTGAL